MEHKTSFKTINEFLFQKDKIFVIPNYQRGYKWAVKIDGKPSAVEKFCDDIINADQEQPYFLQGITVAEEDDKIIIIDGQQRTTTLYFMLCLLNYNSIKNINLKYDIREKSKEFIKNIKDDNFDYLNFDPEDSCQDVHYFKKAINQIKSKLENFENKKKEEIYNFLLEKVTLLYIIIDNDKATKTFTMMNGSKASMLKEELVKAEMLRKVSLPVREEKTVTTSIDDNLHELKEIISIDWETNALRSRYAREWDKWLYWWNREDVKDFFNTEKPLGLLLDFYYRTKPEIIETIKDKNTKFSFDNFKKLLSNGDNEEKKKTKLVFKELRDLQKSFEDVFNIPKIHNNLRLALFCSNNSEDKFNIIDHFLQKKNEENYKDDYTKWRLVGATHRQITRANSLREDEETKEAKAEEALKHLSGPYVYLYAKDLALKQLLRLNIEEDNKLFNEKGRKFDFSIIDNQSLEHIFPKSKVYHKVPNEEGKEKYQDGNNINLDIAEIQNNPEYLNRFDFEAGASEHCIGNLVLLDKNENSKFNNRPFLEKKIIYFDVSKGFKSRNLLHSISVFSNSQWKIKEIQVQQKAFIEGFKKDYNIKL
ncbi:DUF262 domain-containing protein [Marinilabilia salmonicolor]|uniref:DUF262 domain-containing protein n=1 Tax=Marinilabilia salmonicolor TaxID=989 RepID=UPI00029AAA6A|nr:DUF262 domain-containing protein [Marinilabilia salmonicolor]